MIYCSGYRGAQRERNAEVVQEVKIEFGTQPYALAKKISYIYRLSENNLGVPNLYIYTKQEN